jgi:AcrR family transcriptional regulator
LSASKTAVPDVQKPRKRQRSANQIQRNEATRLQMLEAAGRIIGKYGYSGCSIARVTAKAEVAHGTFYLHFGSQQDLFDAVLPVLGARMLTSIASAIQDPRDVIDLETRGFQANFDYLAKHPYMYRVLSEAELFAPGAFKQHVDTMVAGYARSLRRSKFAAQIEEFADDELETIATMLIGARTYLLMRYGVSDNVVKPLPPGKMESYLKFIAHGILGHIGDAA